VISVSHSVSSLKSDQTKQRKTEDRIPTALVTSIRSLTFNQEIQSIRKTTILRINWLAKREGVDWRLHPLIHTIGSEDPRAKCGRWT